VSPTGDFQINGMHALTDANVPLRRVIACDLCDDTGWGVRGSR
jgi:hypothetical protein